MTIGTEIVGVVCDRHLGGYVQGGDPATWCPRLWDWLVETYAIKSVLDIGCGEGQSTRFFRRLGCDVLGIDGCHQAITDSVAPGCVVEHDFCERPYRPARSYDLVWCSEFLEHVPEKHLANVLVTFLSGTKLIALTHAFPNQGGHHHVNCRSTAYWIATLERLPFICELRATRDARTVTLADFAGINHFARSGLIFSRVDAASFALWRCWLKSQLINRGFKLSHARRAHLRQVRAARRQVAR